MHHPSRPACLDPECIIPVSRQSTEVFKTGTWSSIRPRFVEKISPCRAACPVGNNIAKAAGAAASEDFDSALEAFLEESPLPGVCGRVCHHPCQRSCNRVHEDDAVAIRAIERTSADTGKARPAPLSESGKGLGVAVVGSGPAGLSCAYHLARMGHPVTLLEASETPGGLAARGIPAFRLPPEVLTKDLDRILSLPIDLRTGFTVDGKTLRQMANRYAAVFLSPGADAHLSLGISGEDMHGVVEGLAFLRDGALQANAAGARVVVIGGGNTAMDAARVAIRAGARRVTVLYRRTRSQMPAFAEEVADAGAEGVGIDELVAPIAFEAEQGKLAAVTVVRMRLDTVGADGRHRPVPVADSQTQVPCDMAIVAAGQGPKPESVLETLRMEHGRIWVDRWGRTSRERVFAGGDVTPARASVADAMATGKRAALGIHLSTVGGLDDAQLHRITLGAGPAFSLTGFFTEPDGWRPDKVALPDRIALCCIPDPLSPDPGSAASKDGGKADRATMVSHTVEEASRCLRCGTCVGCDRCLTFCPEGAMRHPDRRGDAYLPRDAYCKGCGICAAVCLRGVMDPGGES